MQARDTFLHDIIENGDDDTPRLIFADWLDDHGEPERAELIRLQCQLAEMDPYDPDRRKKAQREHELVTGHSTRWIEQDGIAYLPKPGFRRGFVESAIFEEPELFLEIAEKAYQKTPLRDVAFETLDEPDSATRIAPDLDDFLDLKTTELLRHFRVSTSDDLTEEEIHRLMNCPGLQNLVELDLSFNLLDDPKLSMISDSNGFPKLQILDLSGNPFSARSIGDLAKAPWITQLRELHLGELPIEPEACAEGLHQLLHTNALTSLTHLYLGGSPLGTEGLEILAEWTGLAKLTVLEISGERSYPLGWSREALEHLVQSPYFSSLKELIIRRGPVDLDAFSFIVNHPNAASLRALTLPPFNDHNPVAAGVIAERVMDDNLLASIQVLRMAADSFALPTQDLLREHFGDRLELYQGRL